MRPSIGIIVTAIISFLSGGLAGAVFTWWVNRPEATTVTYSVNSITIADPTTIGVVPKLQLRIGAEDVGALYTQSVLLSSPGGPHLDRIEVALHFEPTTGQPLRVFGLASDSPTPLHSIQCAELKSGARCTLGPVSSSNSGPFRITIASNEKSAPKVITTAKGVQLLNAESFLKTQQTRNLWAPDGFVIAITLLAAMASTMAGFGAAFSARRQRQAAEFQAEIAELERKFEESAANVERKMKDSS